jgi:hypothetical protein
MHEVEIASNAKKYTNKICGDNHIHYSYIPTPQLSELNINRGGQGTEGHGPTSQY